MRKTSNGVNRTGRVIHKLVDIKEVSGILIICNLPLQNLVHYQQ